MTGDRPSIFAKALKAQNLFVDDIDNPCLGFITAEQKLLHVIQRPADLRLGIGAVHLARVARYLSHENRLMLQLCDGQMASVRLRGDVPEMGALVVITLSGLPRAGKPFQAVLGAEVIGRSALLKPWGGQAAGVRSSAKSRSEESVSALNLGSLLPEGAALVWRRRARLFDPEALYQDLATLVENWRDTGLGFGLNPMQITALGAEPRCLKPAADIMGFCQLFYPDLKAQPLSMADHHDLFSQAEQATQPGFQLHDDVQIWFEPTRAAVCIDIDVSGPLDRHLDQMVIAIIQQIMLRRLAGQLLIDLPRTGPKLRKRWFDLLKEGLAYDPRHPDLLGESKGGLTEMSIRHGLPPLNGAMLKELEAAF